MGKTHKQSLCTRTAALPLGDKKWLPVTGDRFIKEALGTKKGSQALGLFHSRAAIGCKAQVSKHCHRHALCNQMMPPMRLLSC